MDGFGGGFDGFSDYAGFPDYGLSDFLGGGGTFSMPDMPAMPSLDPGAFALPPDTFSMSLPDMGALPPMPDVASAQLAADPFAAPPPTMPAFSLPRQQELASYEPPTTPQYIQGFQDQAGGNADLAAVLARSARNTPGGENLPGLADAEHYLVGKSNPLFPPLELPYWAAKLGAQTFPSVGNLWDQLLGNRIGLPLTNASPATLSQLLWGTRPMWDWALKHGGY
jgi:hypothetical protein